MSWSRRRRALFGTTGCGAGPATPAKRLEGNRTGLNVGGRSGTVRIRCFCPAPIKKNGACHVASSPPARASRRLPPPRPPRCRRQARRPGRRQFRLRARRRAAESGERCGRHGHGAEGGRLRGDPRPRSRQARPSTPRCATSATCCRQGATWPCSSTPATACRCRVRNYLVPVDAQLQGERDLDFEAVGARLRPASRWSSSARARPTSCSSTPAATIRWRATWRAPWARARPASARGLAQVQTGVGTFIAYSTQPGNVALDGQGRNSPFTAALTRAQGARPQPDLRHDRGAQGGAGGDRRQAGAVGPFGADGRLLFPPGRRAGQPPKVAERRAEAMQQRLRAAGGGAQEEVRSAADGQDGGAGAAQGAAAAARGGQPADQQRIFDTVPQIRPVRLPCAGARPQCEIGGIQTADGAARPGAEELREQIAKLEADLGLAQPAAGAPSK